MLRGILQISLLLSKAGLDIGSLYLNTFAICRFPFLLVDRVVEYVPQKYAVGYKNVTANDNFFTGHFPERKIMPGKASKPRTHCMEQSALSKEKFPVCLTASR